MSATIKQKQLCLHYQFSNGRLSSSLKNQICILFYSGSFSDALFLKKILSNPPFPTPTPPPQSYKDICSVQNCRLYIITVMWVRGGEGGGGVVDFVQTILLR